MTRALNTILGLGALIALFYVFFRHPKTQENLATAYDNVNDSLQQSYILYFEPIKEKLTKEESSTMEKQMDELVKSYHQYVEKDLGSHVKHTYDTTLHGISIQLGHTKSLLNAVGATAVNKGEELFYKFKGDDLKRWGIRMKLEKDKKAGI